MVPNPPASLPAVKTPSVILSAGSLFFRAHRLSHCRLFFKHYCCLRAIPLIHDRCLIVHLQFDLYARIWHSVTSRREPHLQHCCSLPLEPPFVWSFNLHTFPSPPSPAKTVRPHYGLGIRTGKIRLMQREYHFFYLSFVLGLFIRKF